MADAFIDHDETQIYGGFALRMMDRYLLGYPERAQAYAAYLREELTEATGSLGETIAAARLASAGIHVGSHGKTPLLGEAKSLLGRFSRHLATHAPGLFDRRSFFSDDGTAGAVGRSAPRVLFVVLHIGAELAKPECLVREREHWQAEFERAGQTLSGAVEYSASARGDRIAATPEVQKALGAWRTTYTAVKQGVESILRLHGRLHLMPVIFFDLAMPSKAKLSQMPPDPSEPVPEPPVEG